MSRRKSRLQQNRAKLAAQQRQADQEYGDGPPPEAVQAYADAYAWAGAFPEQAVTLTSWDMEQLESMVIGIAFPERAGATEDEVLVAAWQIKTWHILNGFKYFYDWWDVPVAQMTPQEIIDQIRLDRDNGKVVILDENTNE